MDDSAVDTNIISHYLGAACAPRFASSHESSHTVLSQRGRDAHKQQQTHTHAHNLFLSRFVSLFLTHTYIHKIKKRCGGLRNEGQKGLKERNVGSSTTLRKTGCLHVRVAKNSFVYRRRSECSPPHKYINRLLIKEKEKKTGDLNFMG